MSLGVESFFSPLSLSLSLSCSLICRAYASRCVLWNVQELILNRYLKEGFQRQQQQTIE